MLRKFGLSLAVTSALLAAEVNALGMGEIRVKSALNEPLYAEIALFQIKNLSPLQIKSRMADLNDFALSGLSTQRALSNVRFQVRVRPNGTGRIILTSTLPVTEPFMNFLVEVNWPSGRLIREYTLLLDPPDYQSSLNGRAFNATANRVKAPVAKAQKTKSKATRKKSLPAGVVVARGQYYITPKDTLWEIAIANRPSKKVTPQQMMILMQRKNPQAFPNQNINVMTAKVVIDLPTQPDIDGLSTKEAQTEVTRQTKLWKSGRLPKVSAKKSVVKPVSAKAEMTAAPDSGEKKSQAAESVKSDKDQAMKKTAAQGETKDQAGMVEKGVINVVTPEEAAARREAQAKSEAMVLAASQDSVKIAELLKNNAELDVKLALSQESIDKLERDNSELNKKLETIIEQLADINRLIMLKDEQLAALQDERLDAEKEQQQKNLQESKQSWLDRLLDNTIGLVAMGVGWLFAIIAGVLLLLRRKRKDPEGEDAAVEEKSEPTISLPEEVMEEGLQELDEIEEPAAIADSDFDLDLDLDMDMDLDESFDPQALDATDDVDDNDLAAELEAQLNTPSDEDDDDLDMLEGIDSLEFDLGETDEDLQVDLDPEEEVDAEQQALAEFAAAMDEGVADQDEEDDLPVEINQDTDEFAEDDELEIELEIDDADISSVEDEEMDIADITEPVGSLAELELAEQPAEDMTGDSAEDADVDSPDQDSFDIDDDLEIELEEELDQEISLDSAATDITEEEQEQVPMDDALGDLLGLNEESDSADAESESVVGEEEVLDETLDELLSSTDDDIALDSVAPEFDADSEDEVDLLSGEDGVRMKLDLARAYVEMGDDQGAQDIINEVMAAGDEEQQLEAKELLASLKSK